MWTTDGRWEWNVGHNRYDQEGMLNKGELLSFGLSQDRYQDIDRKVGQEQAHNQIGKLTISE